MYGDTNPKHFKDKPEKFICPKCGHNEAVIDSFAQIRAVRRVIPGNVVCAKCGHAVAAIAM
jgi:transcription elongation factor Elf1